ncbi:MAG: DNA-3-methyladenine glycosylase [Bacteroidota bacterium]|nr:DNA-3-methyladenine glycosylase [Bacteroidota bacterium]
MKLDRAFYLNPDVVSVARALLGKVLFTRINNQVTAGVITETEAYNGVTDKASHAYGGRRTSRTEIMFQQGGTAYIYLCYGIHSLFNVVTNVEGIPHAVLIRAIVPYKGEKLMQLRRSLTLSGRSLYNGPGKVSSALGIHYSLSGTSLMSSKLWIEDKGITVPENNIEITPRIGVDYAGLDALLPYRFNVRDTGFIAR